MKHLFTTLSAVLMIGSASAQSCINYGTGADGPYTATSNTTLPGGTYNYTSFNIGPGVTVTVTGTQPLIIYCTGTATINGALRAEGGAGGNAVTFSTGGAAGIGVAGGANGGLGVFSASLGPLAGNPGAGSGGVNTQGGGWSGGGGSGYSTSGSASGSASGGFGGPAYGNAQLSSLTGGSGGGSGSGGYNCGSGGGGAGGGIIVIYAQTSLTIGPGAGISVNGGNGGSDGTGNCGGGGGGSGGTIWLVSPSMTNNGLIAANGGTGGASNVAGPPYYGTGAAGAPGRIRLDYNSTLSGSGSTSPAVGYHVGAPTQALQSAATSAPASCYGLNDGSALVTVFGGTSPYTYSWAPSGGTNPLASGLVAGTYTCTITDANNCTINQTVTVTEPTLIVMSNTVTNVSCNNACNGSITASATGGTAPYAYTLLPGNINGPLFSNLCPGTYTVTTTDGNGCPVSETYTITEPTAMSVNITSQSNPTTCNGADGSITIFVSGGTPGYTYAWSNGSINPGISNLTAGNYTYTVTDANGCTITTTTAISLSNPAPPTVTVALNIDTTCTGSLSSPIPLSGGMPAGGTYSGPGVSGGVFDANTANIGWNTITYTYMDSVTLCTASSTDSVFVDPCLGLMGEANSKFHVYPNPARQQLFIEFTGMSGANMTADIYDVRGLLVSRQNLNVKEGRAVADVQQLKPGVYFIRIYNGSENSVLRFEKQ